MNKYDFAIGTIVTLLIVDALFIGYCLGLLDFFKVGIQPKNIPAVAVGTSNTSSGTSTQQPPPTQPESKQKQQEQQTEQTIPEDNQQEQQTEQPEENNDTISEAEAIKLVEQMYQNDGHVVVMGQDNDNYTIGCFMEMYYDEETNEPRYNLQTAEYRVNKQTGEVTELKNDLKTQQSGDTETSENKIYTREEINAMIDDNYLALVLSEADLPELANINSSIQDKTINGEICYISMVGVADYPRYEFFWVGSESLNVYTSDNRVIGKITDGFVSSYDDFMALIDNVQT